MKLRHVFLNSLFSAMALSTTAAMMTSNLMPVLAAPAQSLQTNSGSVSGSTFGGGSASIKVKTIEGQALTSRKFVLYQLLTATKSGDTFLYSVPAGMKESLSSALNTAGKSDTDTDAKIIAALESFRKESEGAEKPTNAEFRKFVDAISAALKDGNTGLEITVQDVAEDQSFTITDLPVGYYLLDEISEGGNIPAKSTASLCMLETISDSTEITVKSLTTVIDLIGEDEDGTPAGGVGGSGGDTKKVVDLQIGEKVKLKASITLPPKGYFAKYPIEIQNTLADELDFDPDSDEITIEIDGSALAKDSDFSIEDHVGNDFKIKMEDLVGKLQDESKTLTVTYEAVLKKEAADKLENRDGFKASMELTYPNDPEEVSSTATQEDEVTIFTYALDGVKTDLSTEKFLQGAQFKLYKDEGAGEEIKLSEHQTGIYVPDEAGSAFMVSQETTGQFKLAGIDAGTYYLKEEKAPDGYYPIDGTIKLEVKPTYAGAGISTLTGNATYIDPSTNQSSQSELSDVATKPAISMQIKNKNGSLLPSTGSSMMLIGLAGLAGLLATSIYLSKDKTKKDKNDPNGKGDQKGNPEGKKSLSFDCTIEPIDCTKEEMIEFLQTKANTKSENSEKPDYKEDKEATKTTQDKISEKSQG